MEIYDFSWFTYPCCYKADGPGSYTNLGSRSPWGFPKSSKYGKTCDDISTHSKDTKSNPKVTTDLPRWVKRPLPGHPNSKFWQTWRQKRCKHVSLAHAALTYWVTHAGLVWKIGWLVHLGAASKTLDTWGKILESGSWILDQNPGWEKRYWTVNVCKSIYPCDFRGQPGCKAKFEVLASLAASRFESL